MFYVKSNQTKRVMAKVISIINHKGGVGKTVTTANLGAALTIRGYKTLLIDLDGQANLTDILGISIELENTIYEAMKGKCPLPIETNIDGLKIVPSCLDMSAIDTELLQAYAREYILSKLIDPVKKDYDYILIDCPPSLSLSTINAMTASDSILIPVEAEYLAMRGMGKLTTVIGTVQEQLNPELKIEGIVMTKFNSRKRFNQDTYNTVYDVFKSTVFDTKIRNNVSLGEATAAKHDIFRYAPKSAGAEDYNLLCDELLTRK